MIPSHPPVHPSLPRLVPPPTSVPLPENGLHNTVPVSHVPAANTGHVSASDCNNMAALRFFVTLLIINNKLCRILVRFASTCFPSNPWTCKCPSSNITASY